MLLLVPVSLMSVSGLIADCLYIKEPFNELFSVAWLVWGNGRPFHIFRIWDLWVGYEAGGPVYCIMHVKRTQNTQNIKGVCPSVSKMAVKFGVLTFGKKHYTCSIIIIKPTTIWNHWFALRMSCSGPGTISQDRFGGRHVCRFIADSFVAFKNFFLPLCRGDHGW